MVNSAEKAIDNARSWLKPSNRPFNFRRACLKIVRTAYGIPARYGTAIAAWNGAKQKVHFNGKYNSVPRGVAFFWSGPSSAGHVVLTTGAGLCFTNDLAGPGTYTIAKLSTITSRWGAVPKGWTKDLNGVTYYKAPAAPAKKPGRAKVSYKVFAAGAKPAKNTASQTVAVRRVKAALEARSKINLGSGGAWGSSAQRAARWWQRKLKKPQTGKLTKYEVTRLGKSPVLKSSLKFDVVD